MNPLSSQYSDEIIPDTASHDSTQTQSPNHQCSIHTFIISWIGNHKNAVTIAKDVASSSDFVTVVYSDPDTSMDDTFFPCPSIRRSADLFCTDKLLTCFESFNSDIFLLIYADCQCDDWTNIPRKCRSCFEQFPSVGIWAPLIEFTPFTLDRTTINTIPDTHFNIVSQTDFIVIGLTRNIIKRTKEFDLKNNLYGWGIDKMWNYYSYSIGNISVVDRSIFVYHPRGSSYPHETAMEEMNHFLTQLSQKEKTQAVVLDAIIRLKDKNKQVSDINKVMSNSKVLRLEATLHGLARGLIKQCKSLIFN